MLLFCTLTWVLGLAWCKSTQNETVAWNHCHGLTIEMSIGIEMAAVLDRNRAAVLILA